MIYTLLISFWAKNNILFKCLDILTASFNLFDNYTRCINELCINKNI